MSVTQAQTAAIRLSGEEGGFFFDTFAPVPSAASKLATAVGGGPLSRFQSDFVDGGLGGDFARDYVVVALDSTADTYYFCSNGTDGPVSFVGEVNESLTSGTLPAWAATEGARGFVITAVAPNGTGLRAVSYQRRNDATFFDVQVVTTGLDGVPAAAAQLAAGSYFITAVGRDGTGADGEGGFVLVGTKPQGTSAVRSAIVARGDPDGALPLLAGGYAVVGAMFDNRPGAADAGNWVFVGER
jgi:hypothetical protein